MDAGGRDRQESAWGTCRPGREEERELGSEAWRFAQARLRGKTRSKEGGWAVEG